MTELIALVRQLVVGGTLAVPLSAAGLLLPIITPGYPYQAGDYGRAYDGTVNAGRIAIGPDGTLYFLDYPGPALRKVTPGGQVFPVPGVRAGAPLLPSVRTPAVLESSTYGLRALALDSQGNVFIAGIFGGIFRITPDGLESYYAAELPGRWYPWALSTDPAGNLYALEAPYEWWGTRVLKILPDGTSIPVAGTGSAGHSRDGGPATSAQISATDIAADAFGNFYLAGDDSAIRKVDSRLYT